MAKFRIKSPDGRTFEITAPEGASREQILAYAQKHYAQNPQGNAQANGADYTQDDLAKRYGADPFQADQNYLNDPKANIATEPEQQFVNNANAAGAGWGTGNLLKGLGGLAIKGAGAIGEGMAAPMEKAANWLGSRVLQFGKSNLPEQVLGPNGAAQMVHDAADWAMQPHPEVQQAIMDISGGAPKAVAEDILPASESTVKDLSSPALPSGQGELPAPAEQAALPSGEPERALASRKMDLEPTATASPKLDLESTTSPDQEVPDELGLFDKPILSMSNPTTMSQLTHADAQMQQVGKAIGDRLSSLTATGELYDPAATAKELEGMYIKNASGTVIPAGEGSAQAINNAAVDRALATLKAEALDDQGLLNKLPWERANAIKGKLQKLAQETGDPVYRTAGAVMRNSIDDQAQKLLAASGDDIAPFQQLRDAYNKLAHITDTLNTNARSSMAAKNAVPVVRTAVAAGGIATGNPAVAGAMGADIVGRKFGTLAAARMAQNLSEAPEALSDMGNSIAQGTLKPAARGIASGLLDEDENQ